MAYGSRSRHGPRPQRTLSVVLKKDETIEEKIIADVLIPSLHCVSGTRLSANTY